MPFLQFKGKTAIECYHHTLPHHTLEFDEKLSLLPKGEKPNLEGNLIIEGDNLLALKALLPTHAGRVKCIYIDPPYNTGNEGWVYNDNLTQPQFKEWIGQVVGKEGEDATRHDKWCCMMYPRLQLLKQLLSDKGAIFISIDDNELKNLLYICDEIFGDSNRFGLIVVQNNPRGRRLGTELAVEHEYIVVYAKQINNFKAGRLELTEDQLSEYEVGKDGKLFRLLGLRKRGALSRKKDRPNLHYPLFVNPKNGKVNLENGSEYIKVIPKLSDGTEGVWRWGKTKVKNENESLIAKQVKRRETAKIEWDIFEIDYADDLDGQSKGRLFPSIWDGSEFNNETGRDQMKELFGKSPFDYPKPVDLIKHVILLSGLKDGLMLDSFAGSGTSAQAVLELNQTDGGKRKCILIQHPYDTEKNEAEKFNICQEVTAERARKVIKNIENSKETFSYSRIGAPILGEYKDWGKKPPKYEELAKYIFYTETSREFDSKKVSSKTGKIGEHADTSYYLLYSSDGKNGHSLNVEWLKETAKADKNRNFVVYCEKIWVHRDDLEKFQRETKKTVRPMQVPFNLK